MALINRLGITRAVVFISNVESHKIISPVYIEWQLASESLVRFCGLQGEFHLSSLNQTVCACAAWMVIPCSVAVALVRFRQTTHSSACVCDSDFNNLKRAGPTRGRHEGALGRGTTHSSAPSCCRLLIHCPAMPNWSLV